MHKLDVGDGHARLLSLFLSILQHDYALGGVICLLVILVHAGAEEDHVDGVKPPLLVSRKVMISRSNTFA